MTQPSVSAIVVSFHTGHRLKECVYGLLGDAEVDEIVLVDNGNPAPMRDWLAGQAARHARLIVLSGHGNVGFGAGVNLGAKQAMGAHLLVLNPDAVLRQRSVSRMQETAAALCEPWIIGGRIFDSRGREERGPRRRDLTLVRAMTSFIGWNTWTLEATPPPPGPVPMPVISGAFFLVSAAGFRALGGFDEGYFLHVEDVDLCKRCRDQGGAVMYDPRAGALHYGATSDAPSAVVARHKADSLARYFRVHSKHAVTRGLAAMMMPMVRAALLIRAKSGRG